MAGDSPALPAFPDPRATLVLQYRLEGKGMTHIASLLECDIKTVWNIRNRYGLDALVDQYAQKAFRDGLTSLQLAFGDAVNVAAEIARDATVDPAVRVRASNTVLTWGMKAAEIASGGGQGGGQRSSATVEELVAIAMGGPVESGDDPGRSEG